MNKIFMKFESKKSLALFITTLLVLGSVVVYASYKLYIYEPSEHASYPSYTIPLFGESEVGSDTQLSGDGLGKSEYNGTEKFYKDSGVYINPMFGYRFSYPAGTKLFTYYPNGMLSEDLEAGMTFESLARKYGDNLCVIAQLPLGGSFAVSAKANYDGRFAVCSRTGVGACIIDSINFTTSIMGEDRVASGMKIDCSPEDSYVSYEYSYTFPDKTRIFFSWIEDSDHPASSLEKQQLEVLRVLESFNN